jgi:hypothetical protein
MRSDLHFDTRIHRAEFIDLEIQCEIDDPIHDTDSDQFPTIIVLPSATGLKFLILVPLQTKSGMRAVASHTSEQQVNFIQSTAGTAPCWKIPFRLRRSTTNPACLDLTPPQIKRKVLRSVKQRSST